jgi:hypothetical protein
MPGKVNPVLPEATLMVCAQVIGNDVTVTAAGASGIFELNVMMPVIARNVLESIAAARDASRAARRPLRRRDHRRRGPDARYAESSPSIVTPLNTRSATRRPPRSPSRPSGRRDDPRDRDRDGLRRARASSPRSSSTRRLMSTR